MMMHRFFAFFLASCLFLAVQGGSNQEGNDPISEVDSKDETLQPETISVKNISEKHFNDTQNIDNIHVSDTNLSESVSEDREKILVSSESETIQSNETTVPSDLNEPKNDYVGPIGHDLSTNKSLIISDISDPSLSKKSSEDEVGKKAKDENSYGRGDDVVSIEDDITDSVSNDNTNRGGEMRGDTDPLVIEKEETLEEVVLLTNTNSLNATSSDAGVAASTSPDAAKIGVPVVTLSPSTISWLDAFMLQHRDSLWILFNTFFMVMWIIIGVFVLYRLFGLPWCSPHISRTHYLVIHLLVFTTAAFEFVKLVHFSYGSQQGLPLFLILLLTHTPTPCLASSIILMIHCVFSAARVPIFRKYLPPFQYVAILSTSLILLSFIGDIIVGVSYDSAFLLIHRVILIGICLFCFATFIFNYRKIVNIAQLMRREFRGELKSLAIPISGHDESHEAKIHLKEILIMWSRIVLVCCFAGICMCVFSFCLSIFFTISYVPIWAFWFLHSSIFVSQTIVVLTLTLGAALTLVHTTPQNVIYKYFVPILRHQSSPNNSIIKHGNFHYQRVALSNGSSNVPRISVTPITVVETEEQDLMPNNNLITELSTPPPFKTKINLRRSATFNCAPPPEHTYYGMPLPHCSTPIYPVLSEHLLPQSNSQILHSTNPEEMVSFLPSDSNSYKSGIPVADAKQMSTEDCEIPYGYVSPSRRYYGYGRERFSSLRKIPYNSRRIRPEISSPINQSGMAGALQALEIPLLPCNNIPSIPQEPIINSSFTRKLEGTNNCSSLSSGSPRVKPEPPEKPMRRTDPILVKSVLKDNATTGSIGIMPISPNVSTDTCPKQDYNICKKEELNENSIKKFSPKSYNSTYDKNITPVTSPLKSVAKKETVDLPLCNSDKTGKDFYAFSKVANPQFNSPVLSSNGRSSMSNYSSNNSPVLPINGFNNNPKPSSFSSNQSPNSNTVSLQLNQSPLQLPRGTDQLPQSSIKSPVLLNQENQGNSQNCKNGKNLFPPLNLSSQNSCTDPSSLDDQSIKSIEYEALKSVSSSARQSNETINGHTDIETDNESNSTLKGSSSSIANIETNFDPSTLPLDKKKSSLKRNNSAAGYIPSRGGDEGKSSSQYEDPDDKQQWYGTWGGRKHKRKSGRANQEEAAGGLQFGRQLKKLPVSKGSLSSLYGRLKPKRSKSLYQAGHSKTSDELSSVDNIDIGDGLSLDLEVDIGPCVEDDDDMFLPRVTEEMDLETEILKSSSMLANFYSLKRSDLKNREKESDETEKEPELTNGFDLEVEESFKFLHDDKLASNVAKT